MRAVDGLKRCSKCHEVKPVASFYKDKSKADGLTVNCNVCRGHPLTYKWKRPEGQRPTERRCPTCGLTRPLEDFHKRTSNPGGRAAYCRVCTLGGAEAVAERQRAKAETAALLASGLKVCTKCGDTKPLDQFVANRSLKGGVTPHCKSCWNAAAVAREARNPQAARARQDRYLERNPEVKRMKNHQRAARKRGAPVIDFTVAQWHELLEEFRHLCAYCGQPPPPTRRRDRQGLTQDHVVPLVRGGAHTKDNIVPACLPCNSQKGGRLPAEWLGFVEPR